MTENKRIMTPNAKKTKKKKKIAKTLEEPLFPSMISAPSLRERHYVILTRIRAPEHMNSVDLCYDTVKANNNTNKGPILEAGITPWYIATHDIDALLDKHSPCRAKIASDISLALNIFVHDRKLVDFGNQDGLHNVERQGVVLVEAIHRPPLWIPVSCEVEVVRKHEWENEVGQQPNCSWSPPLFRQKCPDIRYVYIATAQVQRSSSQPRYRVCHLQRVPLETNGLMECKQRLYDAYGANRACVVANRYLASRDWFSQPPLTSSPVAIVLS
jgi:hypothetical protein